VSQSDHLELGELANADIAPVPESQRTWTMWNFAALWVGMAVCIPTYMLAAGLIQSGMSWAQALFTITLGNLIVLVPMTLNAHAGTKYGIPFPVLLRSSFGVYGANIPAMMRALVACGWFGIQSWIGGAAIYALHAVIFEFEPAPVGSGPFLGLTAGQLGCFLLFWSVNIAVILAGMKSIKWLENLAAPFLILIGLMLLWWGVSKAGGFGAIFDDAVVQQVRGGDDSFSFWRVFWPSLTAMVGFWATLSLNIPDFTRYARSQKDQALGQLIGLPTTMALYSFIGIAVTLSTVIIFGRAIWDPVELLARFEGKVVVGFSIFALTIATLSTNIAANIVSPANDFAALWPSRISFRTGGLIAGVIGVLIMPWKLVSDLGGYIFVWLIGYSGLLGAIAGVMIADYYVVRGRILAVADLYRFTGIYQYSRGFHWRAIAALVLGILPNVPGFLQAASGGSIQVPAFWNQVYTYAWFVSLFTAGVLHVLLSHLPLGAPVQVPTNHFKNGAES
jgi:NCS1 family nucleobase:cation symporter-1